MLLAIRVRYREGGKRWGSDVGDES